MKPRHTKRKILYNRINSIYLPDGKNAIHDGFEHAPGGGKALLDHQSHNKTGNSKI